ncbi:MAG: hypothetical protein K8R87_07475 [Verrucomicrobia bacterium]|nr:hypothetical protein [Verrucomicrobiota bacterium]
MFFHPYILCSRGSLNAVSLRREFHGALVKVDDGIGCVHPWPEFGDAPVEEQLKLLREGGTSKVIERALHMAAVDGEARRRGMSLFAGLEIPLSHYSWDQHQPSESQMQRVIGEGWKAIKTKGALNVDETLRSLDALASLVGDATLKFRVDFNSCLTEELFTRFLELMPPQVRQGIDFIEDSFPYDAVRWSEIQHSQGIRLALDKQLRGATEGFEYAVMKPGRRDWRGMINELPSDTRVVMTSAMDHAIGQSFAAYEAALAWRDIGSRMDLCGLCTEHLFAKDVFFERISSYGGNLQVDRKGTGLGFDDVLAKLPWKRL